MKEQLENCNPSVALTWWQNKPNDLMTDDGIFVTREIYKENCKSSCIMKKTCWLVIDLLQQQKTESAIQILKQAKEDLYSNLSK